MLSNFYMISFIDRYSFYIANQFSIIRIISINRKVILYIDIYIYIVNKIQKVKKTLDETFLQLKTL